MKILIVEDDKDARMVLATLAQYEGHEVRFADDGGSGLKLFDAFQPDLVLSDIFMPVMDGLQLLERIRKKSDDTIVVITTAFGSADYTLQALRLRANDYLLKPLLPQEIIACIKKYSNVIAARTVEEEVVGMILNRRLTMKLDNNLEMLGRVANRLIKETECRLSRHSRLGVRLGLLEILTNAIEHGNLGISYQEKSAAMEAGPHELSRLLAERMAVPEAQTRSILVEFSMDKNQCEWIITDDGDGFDSSAIPDPCDPANIMVKHGRGILLARFNFDEVLFQEKGNQVVLRKKLLPIATQCR